ncbi:MAG: acyl-CoA dehydrogenase family protein [Acidimicrobiia bacterium]
MTSPDIEVGLTDEDRAVTATARRFATDVLRPTGRDLDRLADPAQVIAADSPLWDVFARHRELGLDAVTADENLDEVAKARLMCIVNEELAWGDVGLAISVGLAQFHQPWVQMSGDTELIERFVSPQRPTIGCWALTEPDHGSDTVGDPDFYLADTARRPNCIARSDGADFVISGQKAAWVSNGSIADIAVLFCAFDPGDGALGGSVFLVPTDLAGVERPAPLDKLGQRPLNQGEIFFDDVRVPASHRVIPPEMYQLALEGMLAYANSAMGQLFVGVARAAYEMALDYSKERIQGGKAIFEHQSVRGRLFKMFQQVEASRALARRVAYHNAASPPPLLPHAIATKVFCTQAAFDVASAAVQIFGGNGLSREYPIEKVLRDARSSLIEDGCNEMLALVGGAKL